MVKSYFVGAIVKQDIYHQSFILGVGGFKNWIFHIRQIQTNICIRSTSFLSNLDVEYHKNLILLVDYDSNSIFVVLKVDKFSLVRIGTVLIEKFGEIGE